MKRIHKNMLYMDALGKAFKSLRLIFFIKLLIFLEPSIYSQFIEINDKEIGPNFNREYVDFIDKTSNRLTLSNNLFR